MKNRNLDHKDCWKTPSYLYDELNEEFSFDFDPCPLINPEDIDENNNGLLIEWGNSNFVNPPYSQKLKEAFVKRAVEMKSKGKTSVLLLPVSTSTKLFHDVILPNSNDIRFLKGRVKFEGYNSYGELVSNKCGMHDSMIVIMKGENLC